jgi:2-keto-3-deoxy-galactonokinase
MTDSHTPFDHRPDTRLGAALREALTAPGDRAAFVARVLAAPARPAAQPVEYVLARWAARGIVAAAAAAFVAGLVIGRARPSSEPTVSDADPGAMIADVQAEPNMLFASNPGH